MLFLIINQNQKSKTTYKMLNIIDFFIKKSILWVKLFIYLIHIQFSILLMNYIS